VALFVPFLTAGALGAGRGRTSIHGCSKSFPNLAS